MGGHCAVQGTAIKFSKRLIDYEECSRKTLVIDFEPFSLKTALLELQG
jgi:hypothetical protein